MSVEKQVVVNGDNPGLATDEEPDVVDALIVGVFVDEGGADHVRELGQRSHRCLNVAGAGASLVDIGPVDAAVRVEHVDVAKLVGEAVKLDVAVAVLLVIPPSLRIGVEAVPEDLLVNLWPKRLVGELISTSEPVGQIFKTGLKAVDRLGAIPVIVRSNSTDDWPTGDCRLMLLDLGWLVF